MITHVAKLDAASHLNDINNALDERDLDAYHKLFDAYSDDLDKLASIAFEWAREYDVSHTTKFQHSLTQTALTAWLDMSIAPTTSQT